MRVSLAHCSNNSSIFSTLSSLPLESDTPVQHRGPLRPDGVVDHIIELKGTMTNFVDLNFLPFYGHATKMLRDVDRAYHRAKLDGLVVETTQRVHSLERKKKRRAKEFTKRLEHSLRRHQIWVSSMQRGLPQQNSSPGILRSSTVGQLRYSPTTGDVVCPNWQALFTSSARPHSRVSRFKFVPIVLGG